ncbi:hypothetical protein D3P08_01900 [Paenibacillus nanensis]|uniref:Uncharacterized protein n=1 Tax=Paenibacillus nanensis TaxID=393251 RepID=A0A3A1VP79_9BACL|nr:hypothetical protein [Paenibacillus nanensis]RIX60343.1 hypothetical protein D3P08_01900 [Paenibacillus nanensis]
MKPIVFLYSCLTSIFISPFILTAVIANFSWVFILYSWLFTVIPVLVCGIACASINELIQKKVKRRGVYVLFESIVILAISLLGSLIAAASIFDGTPDTPIFLGYGYICAVIYQISTHIYGRLEAGRRKEESAK